jgi:hypothetical protein
MSPSTFIEENTPHQDVWGCKAMVIGPSWNSDLQQAEDIDAIFDQDPQCVCILQDPVAAAHSKAVDEPIKEVFASRPPH